MPKVYPSAISDFKKLLKKKIDPVESKMGYQDEDYIDTLAKAIKFFR